MRGSYFLFYMEINVPSDLVPRGSTLKSAGQVHVFPQTSRHNSLGGRMNWKRFFVVAFALLVAMSLGSARLAAQTTSTGDIAGVVTDPSNAVVPDATVTLRDLSKGTTPGHQDKSRRSLPVLSSTSGCIFGYRRVGGLFRPDQVARRRAGPDQQPQFSTHGWIRHNQYHRHRSSTAAPNR